MSISFYHRSIPFLLCLIVCVFLVGCADIDEQPVSPSGNVEQNEQQNNTTNPGDTEPADTAPMPDESAPAQIGSYNEQDVSAPKLAVYVHAKASLYYIPVPAELASEVEAALEDGEPLGGIEQTSDVLGYISNSPDAFMPQLFYYPLDAEHTAYFVRNNEGEWGLGTYEEPGPIEATAAVEKLIGLASEATGWDFYTDISAFSGITSIEILLGDKILKTINDSAVTAALEAFLNESVVPKDNSKTQNQVVELRCTLENGETRSIFADAWNSMLWLPPSSYYYYSGDATRLLAVLGLESWPEEVRGESEYPYPEGFFDSTYARVGAEPPAE